MFNRIMSVASTHKVTVINAVFGLTQALLNEWYLTYPDVPMIGPSDHEDMRKSMHFILQALTNMAIYSVVGLGVDTVLEIKKASSAEEKEEKRTNNIWAFWNNTKGFFNRNKMKMGMVGLGVTQTFLDWWWLTLKDESLVGPTDNESLRKGFFLGFQLIVKTGFYGTLGTGVDTLLDIWNEIASTNSILEPLPGDPGDFSEPSITPYRQLRT